MKSLITLLVVLFSYLTGSAQCKYQWARWNLAGSNDTAYGFVSVNGSPIGVMMTANYNFDFTPTIFSYNTFSSYPDLPHDTVVPRTTWNGGPNGTTSICFSQPVTNPVLLISSLGNLSQTVVLNFSLPYNVLFDGGGNVYNTSTQLTGTEGFCIIEFPGTFTCLTVFSSTPEFYSNITWGMKNPLKASFNFTSACPGSNVDFSSDSSYINAPGTIVAYNWTFGDNTTSSLPDPSHAYATSGVFNAQLVITSNGGCTDTISHMVIIVPAITANNPQSICGGSSYVFNNHQYTSAGTYYDTLTAGTGCDSIVVTTLTITPAIQQTANVTICSGQDYIFNSHTYNLPGTYYDTLSSITGCDSIIITTLNTNPAVQQTANVAVCAGQNYIFNSHSYNLPGTYYDTLQTFNGCDSVIVTTLSVNPAGTFSNPVSICPGGNYAFHGNVYSQAGNYYDTLSSSTGCDSIVNTVVTLNPQPLVNLSGPTDLCIDDPATPLTISPTGGILFGPGIVNTNFNPQLVSAGLQNLSYIYTDASGCSDTAVTIINVHPLPAAEFSTSSPSASIDDPHIVFTDITPGSITHIWDFGDNAVSSNASEDHLYSAQGSYVVTLMVTDQFGCINSVSHPVEVRSNFSFYISNSFTPNKDGINDLFNGSGVGINNYKMSIYDRWGLKVFETNNLLNPWTADNFPNDTYLYKVELTDEDNNSHEYVGKVSVVR